MEEAKAAKSNWQWELKQLADEQAEKDWHKAAEEKAEKEWQEQLDELAQVNWEVSLEFFQILAY